MPKNSQESSTKNAESKKTVRSGFGIGVVAGVILVLVFLTGVFVGRREGGFLFVARNHGFPGGILTSRFGHGAIGTIDSIGSNTLVVKDRLGELETILVDSKTIIREDNTAIKLSSLKKGDEIVVIGQPQQKEEAIKASFIRVVNEL